MMRGFMLIEVLISVLIASFVSTGLLMTIVQVRGVQQTINTVTSFCGRAAIVQNQMERDLMGAFVPTQIDVVQTTTVIKDQVKPLEKIFYGTSKADGGRFELLTCITSSPLEIFLGIKESKAKPNIARVVYRLVPDEKRSNSYMLMRQEGTTVLSFDAYTSNAEGALRAYQMIDGIQNCTIQYISIEKEQFEGKTKLKYKEASTWESQSKKDVNTSTITQKPIVRLPNQLLISLSLWDSMFENTRTFHFTIPVLAAAVELAKTATVRQAPTLPRNR